MSNNSSLMLSWRDRLTNMIAIVGELHENSTIGDIRKDLNADGVLTGETRRLAVDVLLDIEKLWENTLQIAPALNRVSVAVGNKKNLATEHDYLLTLSIAKVSQDKNSIFATNDVEKFSLEDFMLFLDEKLQAIKSDVRLLSVSRDELLSRISRLQERAIRAGCSIPELDDIQKDVKTDPVKVTNKIDALEIFVTKQASNAESCISEIRIAFEHMDYLGKLSSDSLYEIEISDMREWLQTIHEGAFTAGRYAAALKGLENWAAQTAEIEKTIMRIK